MSKIMTWRICHLRADSAVWPYYTSSVWPDSGVPKSAIVRYICKRLTSMPMDYGEHMNVLKHSVYVQYKCGKQFKVAVSHHHDVMIWFWLHKLVRRPYPWPTRGYNCVRPLPYAYGQHMNVLKHFACVWYGCGKQLWQMSASTMM